MPESLFGAPYLCMHRADLHNALAAVVPEEIVHLDKKLVGLEQSAGQVTLTFADGSRAQADAVIGADGVHSVVREVSSSAPMSRSTKGASPTAPFSLQPCSMEWISVLHGPNGGAPIVTS